MISLLGLGADGQVLNGRRARRRERHVARAVELQEALDVNLERALTCKRQEFFLRSRPLFVTARDLSPHHGQGFPGLLLHRSPPRDRTIPLPTPSEGGAGGCEQMRTMEEASGLEDLTDLGEELGLGHLLGDREFPDEEALRLVEEPALPEREVFVEAQAV